MPNPLLQARAIDPRDPSLANLLDHLQGNILKSHGRDHMRLLPLHFTGEPAEVRSAIQRFTARRVTSASQQLREIQRYKQGEDTGGFGNFFLSAWGYRYMGLAVTDKEFTETPAPPESSATFQRGMSDALSRLALQDNSPTDWDEAYQEPPHAMALLADDNLLRLETASREVERELSSVAAVGAAEQGIVLRAGRETVEPFGFADGRSQPLFFADELDQERNGGGTSTWDPAAALDLVLVEDPFSGGAPDSFGSYLVFRKLAQHLTLFQARLAASDLTAAQAVGRWPNGTPLALASVPVPGSQANDFDYSGDSLGKRCPLHAHVRKVNPRGRSVVPTSSTVHPPPGSSATLEAEKGHRIVRRGMPYRDPDEEWGLLFLCFQSSIPNQFAFIQHFWVNNQNFPIPSTGTDPLIGQPATGGFGQHWPAQWDTLPPFGSTNFGSFTALKGGEFFFAPSLPFLLNPPAGA